jgi:hypothetical protein
MPRFKPPGQCPVCGEWVRKGAAACGDCGACAQSGWSGGSDHDGLDLPDDDFNYDEFLQREFGQDNEGRRAPVSWWWIVAVILFIVILLQAIGGLL